MAMLNFKYGLHKNLPAYDSTKAGTIFVTSDERAMYVDLPSGRVRLSQIITCTFDEWQALTPPFSAEAFYYIIDKNALLKYKESAPDAGYEAGWVQINSTADISKDLSALTNRVTEVERVNGEQNTAITELQDNVKELNTTVYGKTAEEGQEAVIGLVDRMSSAEEAIDNLDKTLTNETTGLAAAHERIDDIETELDGTNGIKAQIGTINTELQEHSNAITEIRDDANIDSFKDVSDSIAATKEELEEAYKEADENLQKTLTGEATDSADEVTIYGVKKATKVVSDELGTHKTEVSNKFQEILNAGEDFDSFQDVKTAIDALEEDVIDKMQAADAMIFKDVVNDESDLPAVAQVGWTYKVGTSFSMTIDEELTIVYVGDLLIASGTEDDNGDLTTISWKHVPSGYIADYNPALTIVGKNNNTVDINLTSGINKSDDNVVNDGDLGQFHIAANPDSAITIKTEGEKTIQIAMEWGSFD